MAKAFSPGTTAGIPFRFDMWPDSNGVFDRTGWFERAAFRIHDWLVSPPPPSAKQTVTYSQRLFIYCGRLLLAEWTHTLNKSIRKNEHHYAPCLSVTYSLWTARFSVTCEQVSCDRDLHYLLWSENPGSQVRLKVSCTCRAVNIW